MNSADASLFATVAATGTFKEAADKLRMTRSGVSKRIARLEKQLGTSLFNRSPRKLSLTEAGQVLLGHCRKIEEALEAAESAVREQDQRPAGTILFSLPTSLAAALMPSLVTDFRDRFPDIKLSIHFGESFVDVIGGGYDLVIRLARRLNDSTLTAQRLMTSPKVLVASPGYLEAHGTPQHVRQLKAHRCLGLGYGTQAVTNWRFYRPDGPIDVPITFAFTSNNDLAINLAACLDGGFIYTPKLLVDSELYRERLRIVLPEFCQRLVYGVYALYPQPSAKVRAFIEFLKPKLQSLHSADRWRPLGER